MSASGGDSNSQTNTDSFARSNSYDQSQTYLDARQAQEQAGFQSAFNNVMGMDSQMQQGRNQLYSGIVNEATGGQYQQAPAFNSAYTGQGSGVRGMNTQALEGFVDGSNPHLQNQINQFGQDIDSQYGVMQQRLGGEAAAAGARGSSRQGIAEANSMGEYLGQFQRGVTDMRSNAYAQQQAAATSLAGLEGQRYAADSGRAAASTAANAQRYATDAGMHNNQMNFQNQQEQMRLQGLELGLQGLGQQQSSMYTPFAIGSPLFQTQVVGDSFGYAESEAESRTRTNAQEKHFGAGLW